MAMSSKLWLKTAAKLIRLWLKEPTFQAHWKKLTHMASAAQEAQKYD
jgi:hypothetical protein